MNIDCLSVFYIEKLCFFRQNEASEDVSGLLIDESPPVAALVYNNGGVVIETNRNEHENKDACRQS